ncbi:MAG: phospholipase D family protein [Nibricoccus sp.]
MANQRTAFLRLFLLGAVACLGVGCVSIRPHLAAEKSRALEQADTTKLGRMLLPHVQAHPGQSGFKLLEYGREALVARTALADVAERTIDAQYYICDPDASGSYFFQRLIAAADRGVRVRLLLDDNNLSDDREMATLCAHPNIQVRVFNPFRFRARWARLPQYAFDFDRMVRRMHNKIFIVDNAVSIIGGRNIGNNYFSLDSESNFRDFDLLVAGPLTSDASHAFDEYWNSQWSVPASRFVRRPANSEDLQRLKVQLAERVLTIDAFESENDERWHNYLEGLLTQNQLVWAEGEIICEPPRKIQKASHETTQVSQRLAQEFENTREELLIESAYLVPTEELGLQLARLRERGVKVKVITSGLPATDVSLVYAAYKRYRYNLLDLGIELYEYKAQAALTRSERRWYRPRSSLSSLHSKVNVFDRERVYIGSANLDPRSVSLNTEIAVLVRSKKLAAQMVEYLDEDFSPRRSWRVNLHKTWEYRPDRGNWREERFLSWTGEQDGRPVTIYFEHATSWWQRTKSFLYSLIPWVENQL